jgi:hypothetical protein
MQLHAFFLEIYLNAYIKDVVIQFYHNKVKKIVHINH